jgi:hypothetical protein
MVTEATLGLTKNTFSAGAHGAGLYTLVTKLTPGTFEYGGVCVIGIFGTLLWLAQAHRTRNLMSYWNRTAAAVELAEEGTVEVFSGQEFRGLENARMTGFKIFRLVILTVLCLWSTALAHSLWIIGWWPVF